MGLKATAIAIFKKSNKVVYESVANKGGGLCDRISPRGEKEARTDTLSAGLQIMCNPLGYVG